MNQVVIIGRVTDTPSLKGEGDKGHTRFTLAVDRSWDRDHADFINCVAFGKTADFISKYFQKGMKMAITGRIQTGSYEKDGKKLYTSDVVVMTVEFCEKKENKGETAVKPMDDFVTPEDSELPFK